MQMEERKTQVAKQTLRVSGSRKTQQLRWREILEVLPVRLRAVIAQLPPQVLQDLEEIRLRAERPLMVVTGRGDFLIDAAGMPTKQVAKGYLVTQEEIFKTVQLMSQSSVYAFEEELRNGYITLRGGHRVGLTGKVVALDGKVKTIKHIAGLNIRLSRELLNVGAKVIRHLINQQTGQVYHTLIVSPPQCGKTTLLRDLIRLLSDGVPELGFPGVKVGVVDERSEISGAVAGVPQNDLGIRTDVLDGCPKAVGMMMLLRSMSPTVIATDELGRREDIDAICEVLNAGVKLVATAHGANLQELAQRPIMREILAQGFFEKFIILGRSQGAGTVEAILDRQTGIARAILTGPGGKEE